MLVPSFPVAQIVKNVLKANAPQADAVSPPSIKTIGVIVGRDQIGDALIKLPFIRALRNAFPAAQIHWITSNGPTGYAGALRDATKTMIDVIHEQPGWSALHEGRDEPLPVITVSTPPFFDLLIDTRNRWREALRAQTIPHRLFLAPALRFMLSNKRPGFFETFLHMRPPHLVDRLLQMVELAAGFRPASTGALPVREDIMNAARKMLPEGKTYIGFAPGAGYAIKIWPRWKFEKLAQVQTEKGRVPVFILGPQEKAMFDILSIEMPEAKFPLQDIEAWGDTLSNGMLTLDHTLAIARCLNIAVANDSGVGHMLAAADCSLISLFGPTSPQKLAPRVSRGRILRAQDFGSPQMKAIPWEVVDTVIDKMLGR